MSKGGYNVWTRVCDPGKKATSWHLLDGASGLDQDDAMRRELSGNQSSTRHELNLEYRMMPVGQRPFD